MNYWILLKYLWCRFGGRSSSRFHQGVVYSINYIDVYNTWLCCIFFFMHYSEMDSYLRIVMIIMNKTKSGTCSIFEFFGYIFASYSFRTLLYVYILLWYRYWVEMYRETGHLSQDNWVLYSAAAIFKDQLLGKLTNLKWKQWQFNGCKWCFFLYRLL